MSFKELMLRSNTPVEHYPELGLIVKREDQACRPPGPQFSKTRGVFAHIERIAQEHPNIHTFAALDTYHSQAGHAVARACQILGLKSITYFPQYKREPGYRPPQARAAALGSDLVGLKAGMSAVLYHQAKKLLRTAFGDNAYMMPNALKLAESVEETAAEVTGECLEAERVIIPISSGTIAAGVIKGFLNAKRNPQFVLHLGYSRSHDTVREYIHNRVPEYDFRDFQLVDEGYDYKQKAHSGTVADLTPDFPCSPYYDLKALRWWMRHGRGADKKTTLLWNIG